MNQPAVSEKTYVALLANVRRTLFEGQRRVEQERVRTYWATGRVILQHILKHNRADYGIEVIRNLSADLNVDKTILNRCVKFARTYPKFPIGAGRHQFSWSHYRELITIADDKKRLAIELSASKHRWSAEELGARIKDSEPDVMEVSSAPTQSAAKPLTPLRGTLYTYRLVERPDLAGEDSGLLVDLGFGIYHQPVVSLQPSAFSKDQIIESRPKEDAYKFYKIDPASPKGSSRSASQDWRLFTYAAYVERVIDGDTIKVRLDLGFNVWTRQTLRLRGIDCAELGTKDGDEAKAFVRSLLKESGMIIVRSSVSDKYDRYLADIYIPQGEESGPATDVYLNNLLIETGRAVRV